jgi:hypothetical protein
MAVLIAMSTAVLPNSEAAPESAPEAGAAPAAFDPMPLHRDTRHGHDHRYPDRGAVVRDLPRGTVTVNYAGVAYRYHDGVWFEPRGPAFLVVAPPIGLIVPTLPTFATRLSAAGESYLYANDIYYRSRPELGGYEVVNAPEAMPAPLSAPGPDTAEAAIVHPLPSPVASPASTATVLAPTAPARRIRTSDPDREARDRYECHRFAVAETGYDPLRAGGPVTAASANRASDYQRAQAACLEALGYSLR